MLKPCFIATGLTFVCAALAAPPLCAEVLVRVGPEFQVNLYTPNDQIRAAVASDADGDFVVAWQSYQQDGNHWGVFGRRFDSSGTALAPEFAVNLHTSGYQDRKDVSFDGAGNFVVVWGSSGQDGSAAGVFGRRFDSAGTPLGVEFQVNQRTLGIQHVPVAAAEANGDFVVGWRSQSQDGDNYGVFARLFDSAGGPKTAEFQVNAFTLGTQTYQVVASDADGDFVVAWGSAGQDGSAQGIFARRFDSTGAALAAEFQVNTFTTGNQYQAAVASDDDGDFVIAWHSITQDASSYGVFARRFGSTGAPQGVEFQVNSFTLGNQDDPAVDMDIDGDFIVVWSTQGQDPSEQAIFARSFNAAGVPQAAEFQINTYVTGNQDVPAVALQDDGAAVVAWESELEDGSGKSIQAQRLALQIPLDVDSDGATEPLTDGLLIVRHFFGFTGNALINSAVGLSCTRCDAGDIATYIDGLGLIVDIDTDGSFGALTDGLLVVRFLFGFTGVALTGNAVSPTCTTRCDAASILPYLQTLD